MLLAAYLVVLCLNLSEVSLSFLNVYPPSLTYQKNRNINQLFASSHSNEASRNKRQRVGPPQRHKTSDNAFTGGRVSVYCVGSSIDIEALRAHVFRRGFSRGSEEKDMEKPDLVLTREIDDDSVLHISNAPLFVGQFGDPESNQGLKWTSVMSKEEDMTNDSPDNESAVTTKEAVMMATQDIFYFDYGCVVFWGLTSVEERAALTELKSFTIEPVTAAELDDRYFNLMT